jgi:hypothetical protein
MPARILRGEKPANLPVQQATVAMYINLEDSPKRLALLFLCLSCSCRRANRMSTGAKSSRCSGAAAAWPLATHAQQSKHMRRVAALMPYTANDPQAQNRNAAFLQGLQQLGWTIGQNVQIDYRWSEGHEDDTRKYAAELVALAPDVIFTSGSAAIGPLRRATRTVPIVFVLVPDPVGAGFVDVSPDPAATLPALPSLITASARNGWRCSRRSHPTRRALRSFAIPPSQPALANGAQFCPCRPPLPLR